LIDSNALRADCARGSSRRRRSRAARTTRDPLALEEIVTAASIPERMSDPTDAVVRAQAIVVGAHRRLRLETVIVEVRATCSPGAHRHRGDLVERRATAVIPSKNKLPGRPP